MAAESGSPYTVFGGVEEDAAQEVGRNSDSNTSIKRGQSSTCEDEGGYKTEQVERLYVWLHFGLSHHLSGRSGGVPRESYQDLQDVLNHRGRRSDHLQNVAQPGEDFHPQQTLESSREESAGIQMQPFV